MTDWTVRFQKTDGETSPMSLRAMNGAPGKTKFFEDSLGAAANRIERIFQKSGRGRWWYP